MSVKSTQLVDDVMRQWPSTIRAFLDHKMRCVGCPIACFHTVDEACHEHSVDSVKFLAVLNAIIDGTAGKKGSGASGLVPAS